MRTRKLIIVISVLLISGIILFFSTLRSPKITVVWGSSSPPVSERAYYLHRIHELLEFWMQHHSNVSRDAADQTEPVTLIIDTDQKRLWVQEGPYAAEENISDMTPGLTWTLYHVTSKGDHAYSGRLRLRLPVPSFRPKPIGDLYLVGQADEGYLSFHLSSGSIESSCQEGMFQLSTIIRDLAAEGESSSEGSEEALSLVIQEVSSDPIVHAPADSTTRSLSPTPPLSEWYKAEGLLYKEIEEALINRGHTLSSMEVVSGPDGTAGNAQVSYTRNQQRRWYHWITQFFRVKRNADGMILLCDKVGEALWYVCSAPESMLKPATSRPMLTGSSPEVEFLVESSEAPGSYIEKDSIALGQTRVAESVSSTIPASPWKKQLSNGIGIEVVGLCAFPNSDGAWWGPDGSALQTSPGFLIPPQRQRRSQQNPFGLNLKSTGFTLRRQAMEGIAMVCRIHLPPGHISIRKKSPSSSAFSFKLSKSSMSLGDSGPILNRYGIPVDRDDYRTIIFDPGQDPIDYGFGIRSGTGNVPNYGFAWVAFRHVAGSPGQTTDFQILEETGLESQ